jgi:hypothetical protein
MSPENDLLLVERFETVFVIGLLISTAAGQNSTHVNIAAGITGVEGAAASPDKSE